MNENFLNGFALTFCFGKWNNLLITLTSRCFRINIGWLAFTVYFYDFEDEVYQSIKFAKAFKADSKEI